MSALWFEAALLPGGWAKAVRAEIAAGRVERVSTGAAAEAGDERHAIALPGLCNVHSHAFQRGMAGLSERRGAAHDDFWSWREIMYRFLGQITPEHVEAIAALAYAEMLESGFTRVGEFHYLHHDPSGAPYAEPAVMARAVVQAAIQTGIGMTLLPVFYAHSDFGGVPPKEGQRRFISDVSSFAALLEQSAKLLSGDANLGLALHSLRAVTPEEMRELLATGPIHIHAAEQVKEVEACMAHFGARPVEWLLANAPVDQRWCVVHATHMTDAETDALAASGAVAGLCPVTESNLGDGVFPTPRYMAQGGRFGLGTDSNILISAAEELRALEYAQRLTGRARAILANDQTISVGRYLFDRAISGGAQALGATSGIAEGASADFFTLNSAHPSLIARKGDALLDSWIFAAGAGAIDCVWRGGAKVVTAGRHRARDAIAARYRDTLTKILAA